MKMLLRNLKGVLVLFLLVSIALLVGLSFQQYRSKNELNAAAGENKQALKTRYALAGTIYDADGVILAQSKDGERIYADDPDIAEAVLQVVGDYTHNIGNTIESNYQNILLGNDRNLFRQFALDLFGKGLYGDDITLTESGELAKSAYHLLDGRKGAIVVLNYQTGDILASVSSPSTSPDSVIRYQDIPDTALFNRAFSGSYAPGSTFKLITASAYLESPAYNPDFTIDCDGQSTVDAYGASETGDGHGTVNLSDAIARSCNVFFGQVGVMTGRDALTDTAKAFGYGRTFSVDRLTATPGAIQIPDNVSTLSWVAIGQPVADSVLYTSPLHMAMIAGCIANGGVMVKPHIVQYFTTPAGEVYNQRSVSNELTALSPELCSQLETMMIGTTEHGTGTSAAVSGYTVAAKTGTVQVQGQKNNALCVAYITDDSAPYAVAVIVEEGGAGGETAAPIAGKILGLAAKRQG